MDFTIVKIMNELGVSEEEARALVEFDLGALAPSS